MAVMAVVLAAGSGTRMRSPVPKVVHEIAGRPMLGWVLAALADLGLVETVVVVPPGADAVTAVLPSGMRFAVQTERLGTAHATQVGLEALDVTEGDQIIVLPGDTPLLTPDTLSNMMAHHVRLGASTTCLTARVADPTGYGRVVRDESGSVRSVVEHKDASAEELSIDEINGGVYVFDAGLLARALQSVESNNAQGERYLPDVVALAIGEGHSVEAYETTESEISGVNSQEQLAAAARLIRARINDHWMSQGVWMQDPDRVYIEAGVTVQPGARLYPDVYLEGATSVDEGAEIGPDVYLRDTDVGANAKIWYAVIRQASIGAQAEVGPYVSLRPGAELLAGSRAGTFVEIKNTIVREGAKVPHLSYVGDADIGEQSNLGAGTITVNYDGFEKHRTVVGKGARVGSNTMLVAPVSIGEGAFTGAGSVITEDVADGALAIERSPQKEVPGYAARKRERHKRKKAD